MTTLAALGEVAVVNPREARRPAPEEPVSFVPMAALDAETATTGPGTERPFAEVQKGYTIFRDQDVLVAKITPCFENNKIGQAKLSRPVGVGSTEFHVIRPKPGVLDDRYVLHFLRQQRVLIDGERRMTGSGGQRRIPAQFLKDLAIPLPPIEEQRRIAEILDQADALRAKRREALALLDDLTQSIFTDMFGDQGWPRHSLAALCTSPDDIKCGPFGTQLQKSEFRQEGIALWGIKNVNADFRLPAFEFVDESTAARLAVYSILPNDIVMTRKGTIGNCALYPEDFAPGVMHSDLLRIRVDRSRVLPRYLSHQLHFSRDVASQVLRFSSGAIMAGINVSKLKNVVVDLPPMELQRQFVSRLSEVEAQRRQAVRSTDALADLFTSLQAAAFSGRL